MDRKIEDLERRIKALEDKLNQSSNMFGRSYAQAGNSDQDYLIKTKGQVKIQWGSKFIDLIKDGKLNTEFKFVYQVDDVDSIGSKDGIYVTSDKTIYINIGGETIELASNQEIGNSFVSFMEPQEHTSEQKYTAMTNIGFIYNNLQDLDEDSLKDGIIYVTSSQKLYIINNGQVQEYSSSFPSSFNQPFIISKESDSIGSLIISGVGKQNSIAFSNMYIYNTNDGAVIESPSSIVLSINGSDNITISDSGVHFLQKIIIPEIQGTNGFRLYTMGGKSILEVDQIIVRDENDDLDSMLYPEYWFLSSRIIKQVEADQEERLTLTLTQDHTFQVGDILASYEIEYNEIVDPKVEVVEGEEPDMIIVQSYKKVLFTVIEVPKDLKMIILQGETTNEQNLVGQTLFLVKSVNGELPLRIKDNNLDIVDEVDDIIYGRIGDLSNLNKEYRQSSDSLNISGNGIYSQKAIFDEAFGSTDYTLSDDDNSTRFATTEWVRKFISTLS